jgi:hypothetical protein
MGDFSALEEVGAALAYIAMSRPLAASWCEKQPIDHRRFNWRWNKKYMVLFDNLIVWYRTPGSVPRGYLQLAPSTTVQESSGKSTALEVVSSSGRTLRFRLPDPRTHHSWLEAIQKVIGDRRRDMAQTLSSPKLPVEGLNQQHAPPSGMPSWGGSSFGSHNPTPDAQHLHAGAPSPVACGGFGSPADGYGLGGSAAHHAPAYGAGAAASMGGGSCAACCAACGNRLPPPQHESAPPRTAGGGGGGDERDSDFDEDDDDEEEEDSIAGSDESDPDDDERSAESPPPAPFSRGPAPPDFPPPPARPAPPKTAPPPRSSLRHTPIGADGSSLVGGRPRASVSFAATLASDEPVAPKVDAAARQQQQQQQQQQEQERREADQRRREKEQSRRLSHSEWRARSLQEQGTAVREGASYMGATARLSHVGGAVVAAGRLSQMNHQPPASVKSLLVSEGGSDDDDDDSEPDDEVQMWAAARQKQRNSQRRDGDETPQSQPQSQSQPQQDEADRKRGWSLAYEQAGVAVPGSNKAASRQSQWQREHTVIDEEEDEDEDEDEDSIADSDEVDPDDEADSDEEEEMAAVAAGAKRQSAVREEDPMSKWITTQREKRASLAVQTKGIAPFPSPVAASPQGPSARLADSTGTAPTGLSLTGLATGLSNASAAAGLGATKTTRPRPASPTAFVF